MRTAARKDRNHGLIVGMCRELGCSVHDTSRVGFGFPDFMLGLGGFDFKVEVKSEDGELSPSQERFQRDWRGSKVIVVRTPEDVIAHVQRVRKGLK